MASSSPPKSVPYSLPAGRLLRPIIICAVVMAFSARKSLLAPGSFLQENLLSLNSSGTALKAAKWIQTGLFWIVYGAHSVECVILARKLSQHGVSVLSAAWWKWIAECFVGGQFCFKHFEGVAKGRRA
ncbi:hypothetical protein CC80DRAFT_496662 [Byssothecium circinans]|uniref:Uncharacterized protein n=1 Tax=Byssothecium circinans TaxID=147558 RepID=A0A6A5TDS1_9PLEO|nr:hypothetical protein CC80DRAFT_496662 [Byssothecium circinans]